jgi:hypothetical protein
MMTHSEISSRLDKAFNHGGIREFAGEVMVLVLAGHLSEDDGMGVLHAILLAAKPVLSNKPQQATMQ